MELQERAGVLEELAGLLVKAHGGSGSLVLVRGEAGIGKTSVVNAFSEQVGDTARVLCGGCDPFTSPQPLGPISDMVDQLDPQAAAAITAALAGGDGLGTVCAQLRRVMATGDRPAVLIIEDAHWADGATLDVLRHLARRVAGLPALLLMTYRDDEISHDHPLNMLLGDVAGCPRVHRISLPPLSRVAVATLAAGRVADIDKLHRVTGGNPFFVTEVIQAGLGADTMPGSVREAALGRMARLTPAGRATADAAAILGPAATVERIEQLASGSLSAGLRECLDTGVLLAHGTQVGFRHELAQRAALDAVAPYRQRGLHASALAALSAEPIAPELLAALAYHAEQADNEDAVIRYGPAAAERAAALGAHREAAELYALVLRHADAAPGEQKVVWLERHAFESYLCGNAAQAAAQSWREAIALRNQLGDRRAESENLRWVSHVLLTLGRTTAALEAGRASLALVEDEGPCPQLAGALVNLAELATFVFDPDAADCAARAITAGTQLGDLTVVMRARSCAAMATVLGTDTGWEDWEAVWHDAMATEARGEHAGLMGVFICWTAALHHDVDRADRYAALLTEFCRERELDHFYAFGTGVNGMTALYRGDWAHAIACAEDVLTRPGVFPLGRIMPLVTLALVRARRGEQPVAELLDQALAAGGEPTNVLRLGAVWAARAEAAWLAGDDDTARAEAQKGLDACSTHTDAWVLDPLQRWTNLTATPPTTAVTSNAVTPYAFEITGDWQTAAKEWARRGCPYDAALAQLGGDDPHATRTALTTFHTLGAHAAAQRAEHRLRQIGHRPMPYRRGTATRANPYGLTPRELDVLALIRKGLTDNEIAASLHIAPKTVGHHVGAILTKLDVHNRRDAAAKSD